MARFWPVLALLAGCAQDPRLETRPAFLAPRFPLAVSGVHAGNYHCGAGSMLAWIGPGGEMQVEIDGVRFYKTFSGSGFNSFQDVLFSYAGTVSDTALPLVINTCPDTVGHAVGSVVFHLVSAPDSASVDTMWVTFRAGIQGGPWPNQVQSFQQWLAYDSTYAGVTP